MASGTRVAFRDMLICGQRYARCVPGYVYLWPAVRALRSGICLSVASGARVAFRDMFIASANVSVLPLGLDLRTEIYTVTL